MTNILSIIITHYQTPVLLKLCLKSIQENIGQLDHEIIVADSQSKKETNDLLKEEFPQVKLISFLKNVGYAKLVNEGIKIAQGDYLFIINHDIIILKDAIPKMLDYMEKNSQVGIIGPQLLTFSNQSQISCFRFPTISTIIARRTFLGKLNWGKKKIEQFSMQEEDFSLPKPVDWVQGSAMFVRKEAVEQVGLWDERFFLYLEDTDWCRRFWQNGYQVIYLPTARVSHYYGQASKRNGAFLDILFNKYTRLHIISFIKYLWKWRGKIVRP
ncbi:MAG: glycosyltransferase family 2 protein [Patescibacteria group bacterium]